MKEKHIEKSVMNISELVELSEFFKNWNGKQLSKIPTTNPRLANFKNKGIDTKVSIKDIKQLRKFDPSTYYKLAKKGFTYTQGRHVIEIKHNKAMVGTIKVFAYSDVNEDLLWIHTTTFSNDNLVDTKDNARDTQILTIYRQFTK